MQAQQIQHYLEQCVSLAHSRLGHTSPNPAVASVVVCNGEVIARGVHQAAGQPHAEVMALQQLQGRDLSSAVLFVSLEPCCHHGRTPPCTDAIIASGIKQVFYAHQDQNPEVAGRSQALLAAAGVNASYVPIDSAKQLYRYYDYWRTQQMPWVTAKLAISRDGCYRSLSGDPVALTGEACRHHNHAQRACHDAILTTFATLNADNPQLNVRQEDRVIAKPVVVLDRKLQTKSSFQIFGTSEQLVFVHDLTADAEARASLAHSGAELIALDFTDRRALWQQLMQQLALRGWHSIWVEAGATLFRQLWQQQAPQDAYMYVGGMVLGDRRCSAQLAKVLSDDDLAGFDWQAHGNDFIGHRSLSPALECSDLNT